MPGLLARYLRVPSKQRRLYREAAAAILWAYWRDRRLGYPRSMEPLGKPGPAEPFQLGDPSPAEHIKQIRKAVVQTAHRMPFHVACRVEALAAHRLLKRRGIESQTWIGARRHPTTGKVDIHAWLVVGKYVVTGREERHSYTPLATYRDASKPSSTRSSL